jgi:hypothetical protein
MGRSNNNAAVELDRLVREQRWESRRDLRRRPLRTPYREVRECDLSSPLAGMADRRADNPADLADVALRTARSWRLVGDNITWTAEVCRYDPAGGRPCPGCHDRPRRRSICLVCLASPEDPRPHPQGDPRAERLADQGERSPGRWLGWAPPLRGGR